MIKFLTLSVLVLLTGAAEAKIEVLFHPTDPTLEKVAQWIDEAHGTIDIAMYSMDTSAANPVMKMLASASVQDRLHTDALSIRLIFEGYRDPADTTKKMQDLENVGVDVRFLKSGKKVHHKFAVIDASLSNARAITGSANWSMASYRNYDENILFMQDEPESIVALGLEFESLWQSAAEFGVTLAHPTRALPDASNAADHMDFFFNSPRVLFKKSAPETFLSSAVVRMIESAKSEILIATTRVRLEPILIALKAAGDRGVKIKVLISEDDVHDLAKRSLYLLNQPNLELRVKFYNLNLSQYMAYQMHNKFLIVDRQDVGTGSFNWSDSSENSHVENFIHIKGVGAVDVMPAYLTRFDMLWERGRGDLPVFEKNLADRKAAGEKVSCGFSPMSLTYEEIRSVLKLAPKCGAGI